MGGKKNKNFKTDRKDRHCTYAPAEYCPDNQCPLVRLASITSSQELNPARTQGNRQSENFHFLKHHGQNKKKEKTDQGRQNEVKNNSDTSKGCQISHTNYKYFHGHNNYTVSSGNL